MRPIFFAHLFSYAALFAVACSGVALSDPPVDVGCPDMGLNANTATAWQGSQTLTSSQLALGQSVSLLQAAFDRPDVYTIEFNVTVPPNTNVRCQAIVNWKIKGTQIQRVFDIGSLAGTTISGAADGVDVRIVDLTASLGAGGTDAANYTVTAGITRGTKAQVLVPLIQAGQTAQVGLPVGFIAGIAPGATANFPVPQNAGVTSCKIMVVDNTTKTTRPTFVQASQQSAGGATTFATWIPDDDPSFVPLIPGATVVQVANFSGTDSVAVSVFWGIDG